MTVDGTDPTGPSGALILSICANPDNDFRSRLEALGEGQWVAIADTAWEVRAMPLLARAITVADAWDMVPGETAERIKSADQWHRLNGLRQALAAERLATCLAPEGLSPVFLKGFSLAYRDYPEPHLRPMRDFDLLLPEAEARRAQDFLLSHEKYRVLPAVERHSAEPAHHFKALQDRELTVTIEVHHRPGADGTPEAEKVLTDRLLHRAQTLPGNRATIQVPHPHDNMLHLIEHAALHHLFENGPLTLSDMHYLSASGAIDWNVLVEEARSFGIFNALCLIAAIARQYGAGWIPDNLQDKADRAHPFVAESSKALLQTRKSIEHNKLLRRLETGASGESPGWQSALRKALRPDPAQLAGTSGADPDSLRRWTAYPGWLANRAARYLAARRQVSGAQGESREQLTNWLRQD